MPRCARKKSDDSTYHIMSRSISEVNLFQCDEDKDYYMSLLKKYASMHHCSIYAYCLMDNHLHLYINTNGFDISCFMHCLNTAYVCYFNKRYNRHGHLFQGRFASNIVTTDAYSLTLSAYIHNNPKDVLGFKGREECYPYSSYGIYIGKAKDRDGLVDKEYVLGLFSNDMKKAAKKYHEFTKIMWNTGIMTEIDDDIMQAYTENEYRNEKQDIIRNVNAEDVLKAVCTFFDEPSLDGINLKYHREKSHLRALAAYGLRILCGFTYKKISCFIGDMSLSGIKRLSNKGYEIYKRYSKYSNPFSNFHVAA